jgi:hypothetical protein
MPLPTLESPKYVLTVPSTSQSIEYRPFLVKEEKILLLAQEANSSAEMISAIKDIIHVCTFNNIKTEQLTSFDIEYIFLKLRAKSVGEISNIKCKCEHCETYNEVAINIDEIQLVWPEAKLSNKIMLTDKIGIILQYIKVNDMSSVVGDDSNINMDAITNMIIASIETIFDDNGVYRADETSHEELLTFVNSLNRAQLSKIEQYIAQSPKLEHNIKFKCVKCKKDNDMTLSGIQSFFE